MRSNRMSVGTGIRVREQVRLLPQHNLNSQRAQTTDAEGTQPRLRRLC